jgi:hypothetical protein
MVSWPSLMSLVIGGLYRITGNTAIASSGVTDCYLLEEAVGYGIDRFKQGISGAFSVR